MKLTVIGAGNMGGALIKGWAKSGKVENVTIADKNEALLAQFKADYPSVNTTTDNVAAVQGADIIVLVVKPWLMRLVLAEVKPVLNLQQQIIVSDAANFTTAMLAEELGQQGQYFYVIPNIAAEFAASMSFIAKGEAATADSLCAVENLWVSHRSSDELTLHWTSVGDGTADLTVTPVGGGTPTIYTDVTSPFRITGLTPSTSYQLTLTPQCTGEAGDGLPKSTTGATLPGPHEGLAYCESFENGNMDAGWIFTGGSATSTAR